MQRCHRKHSRDTNNTHGLNCASNALRINLQWHGNVIALIYLLSLQDSLSLLINLKYILVLLYIADINQKYIKLNRNSYTLQSWWGDISFHWVMLQTNGHRQTHLRICSTNRPPRVWFALVLLHIFEALFNQLSSESLVYRLSRIHKWGGFFDQYVSLLPCLSAHDSPAL